MLNIKEFIEMYPFLSVSIGLATGFFLVKIPIRKICKRLNASFENKLQAIAQLLFEKRMKKLQEKERLELKRLQLAEQQSHRDLETRRLEKEEEDSKPFQHVFHGSELRVGDFQVVSGLNNGVHNLEIVQGSLYVDNKVYPANKGDLPRIRMMLRQIQANVLAQKIPSRPMKQRISGPPRNLSSKSKSKQPQSRAGNTSGAVFRAGLISRPTEHVVRTVKREDEPVAKLEKHFEVPETHIKPTFEHMFYGTSLTIDNFKVVVGLTKKMHRLEIIGEQMFVDNKLYAINQGDLLRVQETIERLRLYG